jgi:cystathionine beta-synthase
MFLNSITEAVGNTPLVKLRNTSVHTTGTILVKVEYFNPGNSIKDRIAIKMIEDAEKKDLLKPGGTIVEGTSGNTGMGLALVAIAKGYKCIFTTTDKQSQSKVDILKAMGAEVIVCPTNVEPDDPRSYYSVAARLAKETENCYYPNQYHNKSNLEAHYETTGPEIWEQTEGKITHYVAGMGTGGTISGVGKFLKEQNPDIHIIGVDSVGSVYKKYFETGVFDKNEIKPYMTEGIGEDIIPGTIDFEYIDYVLQVNDKDSALETRALARKEGLFVGWSCGAAVAGAKKYIAENPLKPTDLMVVILPDSGTRYIGKVFNDKWMKEQGLLD